MDRAATPFGGPMSDGRGRRRVSRGDHAAQQLSWFMVQSLGRESHLGGVYERYRYHDKRGL